MNLAPPPPTQFRELSGPVAERITTLWRLATDDDQRWEIERLAVEIMAAWQDLRDALGEAAADAVADVLRDWKDNVL